MKCNAFVLWTGIHGLKWNGNPDQGTRWTGKTTPLPCRENTEIPAGDKANQQAFACRNKGLYRSASAARAALPMMPDSLLNFAGRMRKPSQTTVESMDFILHSRGSNRS